VLRCPPANHKRTACGTLYREEDSCVSSNITEGGKVFIFPSDERTDMPQIDVDEETIERLDSLRLEDESYEEIINELINIYEAEELALFKAE